MSATTNCRLTLCFRIRNLSVINRSLSSVGAFRKDFPNDRKNSRCFHQSLQMDSAGFARKAKRVYYPLTDGELKAKESLSALPQQQQRENYPPNTHLPWRNDFQVQYGGTGSTKKQPRRNSHANKQPFEESAKNESAIKS